MNGSAYNATLIKRLGPNLSFETLTAAGRLEITAWLVITPMLSFTGMIINLSVLFVTWPTSSRKSTFGVLVFHFVAVNFLMCLLVIPIGVFMVVAKRDGYAFPANICSYMNTPYSTGIAIVNWTDTGLAINRIIALFFPFKYKTWCQMKANIILLIFTWVGPLCSTLLVGTGLAGSMLQLSFGQCVWNLAGPLGTFAAAFNAWIPYSITGVCSILILSKSCNVTQIGYVVRPSRDGITQAPSRALERRLNMAKMMLYTFLWSAICTAPTQITAISPRALSDHPLSALWTRTSLPCQYGFTPCILLLSNAQYRGRLAEMLGIKRRGRIDTLNNPSNGTTDKKNIPSATD